MGGCGERGMIRLIGYVLLTYAVTWTAWFTSAAFADAAGIGILFGLGGPVFLLGVFAPGLVAIAIVAAEDGRAGVVRLLAQIGRWQVGGRWYLFAVGYFIAIKLGAALLQRVITGGWPPFGETPVPLMLGAILVSTWSQAGEEVGWRGHALPRLAQCCGLGGASIVLGIVWAVWHLPLFFIEGSGSQGQSFPVYLLHVIALSVAMAWLYWKTRRSLLLVMVMHASVNNTTGVVTSAVPGATDVLSLDGSLVAWITVGLSWVVALAMLLQMRGADLREPEAAGRES